MRDNNYYEVKNKSERLMPASEVNKILLQDKKIVEEQSQQMLTLVDIISAFTTENNELKQQNINLHNALRICNADQQHINNRCIDQNTYNNQGNQIKYYLNFQNLIFVILLFLLIILIFYRCVVATPA